MFSQDRFGAPYSIPSFVLGRLRKFNRRSQSDATSSNCPVDALRDALARESDLLRQKDLLIQEQELLRRESDHRLLNGLQMVVSLLSMQTRAATNPDVAAELSVAARRIATIERVHRRLHSQDGAETIALKRYVEEFCRDFGSLTGSDASSETAIIVKGCEMDIPSATAIPLGFILNELITNAVKYGEGSIVVGLETAPGGGHILSVCNGGLPLPAHIDVATGTGLGMKIVNSLVAKIGGELSCGPRPDGRGARFVVTFH